MDHIYQELVGKRLFTQDRPRGVEDPHQLPAVTPSTGAPRTFAHDDGSAYTRVPAVEFEDGDQIDSTTIDDPGAPD